MYSDDFQLRILRNRHKAEAETYRRATGCKIRQTQERYCRYLVLLSMNARCHRAESRFQSDSDSGKWPASISEVPNILQRHFHAASPNQKWLTDLTEFALPAGKVYLSPVIDCFDGMVHSWTIGTSPNAQLVNNMLEKALATLRPGERPIIHSDRGCHYRWPDWIKRVDDAGLTRSMSRKGCSPDNSACEGFFGRLKNEMFYGRSWDGNSGQLHTLVQRGKD